MGRCPGIVTGGSGLRSAAGARDSMLRWQQQQQPGPGTGPTTPGVPAQWHVAWKAGFAAAAPTRQP